MTAPRGSLREILAPIRAASGSGGAAERSPTRERNRGQRREASEILEELQVAANRPKIRTPATDPAAAHRLQIMAAGGAADQMRASSGKMPGRRGSPTEKPKRQRLEILRRSDSQGGEILRSCGTDHRHTVSAESVRG